ncbi:alpha/beta fold hydrolase [Paludisphaera mucosa]|uniref:Alpha/beta fold hydrolase n=1 Tax=Paludisphaera mucosa TaxID=3030827 RepID=A0ABT6FK00_9BACT|nr:alpha/beta fold hydrolase [Paludisphaera mucosa]MDG3007869.1 alpha/beta fold hydrolase [Paludisphaera mucosa]
MSDPLRHVATSTNGLSLHVVEAGPEDGPPVILLHGFPETWLCWRRQIGPLAEAGLRVLAPDQRGYDASDKPGPVSAYALDTLADDVIGLIESTGRPRAALVGHDWGGIVAWWVATRNPERVERLAILNAPHPAASRRYLLGSPRQLMKSWYVFFFQTPWLPEALCRRKNWRMLTESLLSTSRPGTFSEADLDAYRAAWSRPGAITAMIHWYRALLRYGPSFGPDRRVTVPTLVLWGAGDRFLERGIAEASLDLCDRGELEFFEEATHWIQHEEPDRVNRRLVEFLRGGEVTPR